MNNKMKQCTSIYQMSLRTMTPGGTLNSAMEMLPFVAQNGFEMVYICPICVADDDEDRSTWSKRQIESNTNNPKNPYKIIDYFNVDPEYGTNADLLNFVNEAHKNGLKVMLDIVYLHCGKHANFIEEHPDYVKCDANGKPIVGDVWPFARINYESKGAREYIISNMLYYVENYGIDAYRCDAGDEIPLDFWDEAIGRVKEVKEDIIMLNEGIKPEYTEKVFDLNYMHSSRLIDVLNGNMTIDDFIKHYKEPHNYLGKFARMIDNHDIASDVQDNRLEIQLGSKKMEVLIVMNYIINGIPFIWNGLEVCDDSPECMFSNRFYGRKNYINWSYALTEKGKHRLSLFKKLNKLRHENPDLQTAETEFITENTNVIIIKRKLENKLLVGILNLSETVDTINLSENMSKIISHNTTKSIDCITLGEYGYYIGFAE
ncbi:MAG: alpha-amylase family glycosyl hydrolase [Monoglobaceae bacterium]